MTLIIPLLKTIQNSGFFDIKKEQEPFQIIQNESFIIHKLSFLYESKNQNMKHHFIWSNFGPYSPEISDELIEIENQNQCKLKQIFSENDSDLCKLWSNFIIELDNNLKKFKNQYQKDDINNLAMVTYLHQHNFQSKIQNQYDPYIHILKNMQIIT